MTTGNRSAFVKVATQAAVSFRHPRHDGGLLDELPAILRVHVGCAARLYGNPREADLIKIHLHSRKLTFHYYRDFDKAPLPEPLTRIKIDLKRLFVSVIDHTTGSEHQLLFFKERFLAKDHPDRPKMARLIRPGTTGTHPYRGTSRSLLSKPPTSLRRFSARNSASSASAGKPSAMGRRRKKWDKWNSRAGQTP